MRGAFSKPTSCSDVYLNERKFKTFGFQTLTHSLRIAMLVNFFEHPLVVEMKRKVVISSQFNSSGMQSLIDNFQTQ